MSEPAVQNELSFPPPCWTAEFPCHWRGCEVHVHASLWIHRIHTWTWLERIFQPLIRCCQPSVVVTVKDENSHGMTETRGKEGGEDKRMGKGRKEEKKIQPLSSF
jgi:hypothetical protein